MRSSMVLGLLALAGCAHPAVAPMVDLDQRPCPGAIQAPEGLREVQDEALLRSALGRAEQGQICAGRVFEVQRPLTVHRVWQRSKPYSELGRWWSLSAPRGGVADFRRDYVDCPEWSTLDAHTVCTLKVGARVVLGTGQSARCADGSLLAASPALQVFVPNDGRAGRIFVEGCGPPADWPEATRP